MKYIVPVLFFVTTVVPADAQTVTPLQAGKHIGDSITVCGEIFGGRFFETSNGSPTLLNMGAAFPKAPLTIMIPGDVRTRLGYLPEIKLKEKNVCVKGRVSVFKNKPEIIIHDPSQITMQ